jgi:hypothetical protein
VQAVFAEIFLQEAFVVDHSRKIVEIEVVMIGTIRFDPLVGSEDFIGLAAVGHGNCGAIGTMATV